MLVLSRKISERIKLGDDVTLTILRVRGERVTVGITAPESVRIVREELPARPVEEGKERAA